MPIKSGLFKREQPRVQCAIRESAGIGWKMQRKGKRSALGLIRLHRREAIQIDGAPLRRIVRSSDVAKAIDWLPRRRCMVYVAQQHLWILVAASFNGVYV